MASRFPIRSAIADAAAPRFNREQVEFLEDILINKVCGRAMLNSLSHVEGDECMACAARVETLVNTIRSLEEE